MWWSYSDCHKCGHKSSSALSRRLLFIRSCTNHSVKHNSEEVIKLFISHLPVCLIFGEQDRKTPPRPVCCLPYCSQSHSDGKGHSLVKLFNLMSVQPIIPDSLKLPKPFTRMSSRRPATLNWAVQAWDDEEPNWKFFRQLRRQEYSAHAI